MNKLRFLLTIALTFVLSAVGVSAQDNGLNPVYKVQLTDITYQKNEVKKKVTVGKVLSVMADVVEGRVTDINNEEYIPLARNRVLEGLTHVRRLQVVEDSEASDAKYQVSAVLTDIAATRKVKAYDRKDSKGREYTETKTYYGAIASVALHFTNLQTGEVTTSTLSGRCSEYSLARSADEAIRSALDELSDNIYEYYNECYPVRANIIERGIEKKDKTKELYIDVGSRFIGEDIHFDVFVVGQVAGRETRKQIGRIRVRETLGDDISLCKVQKGGKEIKAAFDRGDAIVAISTD
ncbi:MAG: hypothetical protein E7103_04315 [Prevotella sp.]|jgi:hypothetical protein|nr:hypothetical protein [Prevotella sp.]